VIWETRAEVACKHAARSKVPGAAGISWQGASGCHASYTVFQTHVLND
jgi:hypothetical protein